MRSEIPIDRRKPGLVQGVKAGLSLSVLSPAADAGEIESGEKAYDHLGSIIVGTKLYAVSVTSLQSEATVQSTSSLTYVDVTGKSWTQDWGDALIAIAVENAGGVANTKGVQVLYDGGVVTDLISGVAAEEAGKSDAYIYTHWIFLSSAGSKVLKVQFKKIITDAYVRNVKVYRINAW